MKRSNNPVAALAAIVFTMLIIAIWSVFFGATRECPQGQVLVRGYNGPVCVAGSIPQ